MYKQFRPDESQTSGRMRYEISNNIIEKVKQLKFKKEPHIGLDETAYPPVCLDQNAHYNTGHAIKDQIDWSWTSIFVPDNWIDVGLAFDKSDPGYIIPMHRDHFKNYCDRFGHARHNVKRRLVFLEGWKDGHYFQLEDKVYHHWSSGDWAEWSSEQPHMGANVGSQPRYTLQITGVPNE